MRLNRLKCARKHEIQFCILQKVGVRYPFAGTTHHTPNRLLYHAIYVNYVPFTVTRRHNKMHGFHTCIFHRIRDM